mmetsp:Transcript_17420/g.29314  ORF Transcript_17420/g.29314 Transcript_17420/m.29314 type:complete len:187 (-) Transcript_17420:89-649(-)
MTWYEAKKLHLPLPDDFGHKKFPLDQLMPEHMNDVRFNYFPQNLDRRCFIHDFKAVYYNFEDDMLHTLGFPDQDLDYELPDPYSAMHFKIKRSPVVMMLGAVISIGVIVGYPILGLKMPQTNNPTFWRKKYGTTFAIQQAQEQAVLEYGDNFSGNMNEEPFYSEKGFHNVGNGVRIDLPSYGDMVR